MPTSRSYQSYLIDSLKDPKEAAAYLDAVFEDSNRDEIFLATKNILQAEFAIFQDFYRFQWLILLKMTNFLAQRLL